MEHTSGLELACPGKLIVVLGMHRSGTSATTRALIALGANLGNRLLAPIAGNNDKGFFEDVDVLKLNIELLAAAGTDWHLIGAPDLSRIDPLVLDRLQPRAVSLLRERCRHGTFALKDPRLCRLLPFWQPVFGQAGLDVRYVIATRNPISVAQSLFKRDQFSDEKSHLLWLAHTVPSLAQTRDAVRVLVDYDRLIDEPAATLRRMATQLRLPLDDAQATAFGEEFVEEGLRHTRFDVNDVYAQRSAPMPVKRFFAELDRACETGEPGPELEAALEAAQQYLADLEPALRFEIRQQQQIAQQIGQARLALQQRDQQIKALTEALAERNQLLRKLELAVRGRVQQTGSTSTAASAAPASTVASAAPASLALAAAPAAPAAPRQTAPARHAIYSFIVDTAPKFAYQGIHLARSLIEHACDRPEDVHVQFTPEVGQDAREPFRKLGCTLHELQRFGDGRYCNKLAQLGNLHEIDCTHIVLLDTDMIAVDDIRPFLKDDAVTAKTVDLPRPSVDVLAEIAKQAGITALPQLIPTDAIPAMTYAANCNGGFYGIPRALARRLDEQWRRWALWLLDHIGLLAQAGQGYEVHVDQVSFWLTVLAEGIPFRGAPTNVNYYVHLNGARHTYFDASLGIALLHYHDVSLGLLGKLEPPARLDDAARAAVAKANEQIGRGFDNASFWDLRYANFPQRGSGIGSRGDNLRYKRDLLRENGIESSTSVLDVGCGDLEILKDLTIQNYLGIDVSHQALQTAQRARPDWNFRHASDPAVQDLTPRELVLCFEVLIHQPTEAEYRQLIELLARNTKQTLIVSGYVEDYRERRSNSMVHFYEPLNVSLERTGKFKSIRRIGAHSDVTVFRCDV